ncbi:hypothetical protein ACWGUL_00035 [Streptomyces albidoflavus]
MLVLRHPRATPDPRDRRVPGARTILLCIASATVVIAVCASVL